MNIEDLERRVNAFEFTDFCGPVSRSSIDEASYTIGLPFGQEYRAFLGHFGSGGVESEEFIGLGGAAHLNVILVCKDLRRKVNPLPNSLIPLRGDGSGNYDCADTTSQTANDEFAVVRWFHDGGPNQTNPYLAPSYFEWFNSILNMLETI